VTARLFIGPEKEKEKEYEKSEGVLENRPSENERQYVKCNGT
jgi:hypothetical protein